MGMGNKNKIILVIIAAIIAILLFIEIATLFATDTEKIRHIIYSAKAATEKEDLFKYISYVSIDYNDKDDNNRSSLFLIGKNVFANYDDIKITIADLKIDIISKARAVAHIWASGQGRRAGTNVLDIQRVEFEAVFRKEGYGWKVIELKFIQPENFLNLLKRL